MNRVFLLDSGPLGLISQPKISAEVSAIDDWLLRVLRGGDLVLIPAIIYYELRRELLRAQKVAGLARLNALLGVDRSRYLALTDESLQLAAELWARTRQQGRPTSAAADLDIDVILAAQALTLRSGSNPIVITTNPRHLRLFVDARLWADVDL